MSENTKVKTSGVKKGKQFEQYMVMQFKKHSIKYIRLRDVSMVNGRKTKSTKNPCDYIVFIENSPTILLECKACKSARLPINRITQLEDLKNFLNVGNCYIAINYYDINCNGSKKKDNCKKVIVNVKDILDENIKSIKYDDDFAIDFQEWLNEIIVMK